MIKILIAGAHFTPAQAVIEELSKQGVKIVYVGRQSTLEGDAAPSVESSVLPKLGVKFIPMFAGRFRRTGMDLLTIFSIFKIPFGFIHAILIILFERPDAVLSFGGYVGAPIIFAAWLFSIPSMIHEQTLVSSLSNEFSKIFANKVTLAFKRDKPSGSGVVITGNPIRAQLLNPQNPSLKLKNFIQESMRAKLPLILITGGNQGSHVINEVIVASLADMTRSFFVIHQTGDSRFKDFERMQELSFGLRFKERYLPVKWLDAPEFGFIARQAKFAISRAGINTLYEFLYFALPSILVPLPGLYKDEQHENARYFTSLGLSKTLTQNRLSAELLMVYIKDVIKNYRHFKTSAIKAKSLVIPDAAKRITQEVLVLVTKKS